MLDHATTSKLVRSKLVVMNIFFDFNFECTGSTRTLVHTTHRLCTMIPYTQPACATHQKYHISHFVKGFTEIVCWIFRRPITVYRIGYTIPVCFIENPKLPSHFSKMMCWDLNKLCDLNLKLKRDQMSCVFNTPQTRWALGYRKIWARKLTLSRQFCVRACRPTHEHNTINIIIMNDCSDNRVDKQTWSTNWGSLYPDLANFATRLLLFRKMRDTLEIRMKTVARWASS